MSYEKKDEDGVTLHTGYRLKFYYDENVEFSDAYASKMDEFEADDLFEELRGFFPCLHNVTLVFEELRGRVSGRFKSRKYVGRPVIIINSHDINVGILCHEVAHAIDYYERGRTKHDRYLYNILRMVIEKVEATGVMKPPVLPSKPTSQVIGVGL